MRPFCLSSASILRCNPLAGIQQTALIIPTAFELVFSVSFVQTHRNSSKRHFLLVAEGWTFLALSFLDLLSHIIPAARNSITVFKVLDIVIGSLSFIPILFYTAFLFSRAEFILARRFYKVSNYILFLSIPVILILNEIASFVGISHGMIDVGTSSMTAAGFRKSRDETLFSFFTSLTLALLAAYQAINFTLSFYRLVQAPVDQHRIETSGGHQSYLPKNTGWITSGLLIGATETIVGLAQNGFRGALTRRILRLLSRALFIIGLVKELDTLDRRRTESGGIPGEHSLRPFISHPRFSTFRKMSPETTITFHSRQRLPALKMSAQRVTVNYGPGHTPTLEMRFSALGIPSPFAVVNSTKLPPSAEWLRRPCSLAVSLPPVAPAAQVRPLTIAYRYSSGIHQYATAYPSTESVETVQTLDLRSLPPEIRCQGWQDSCLSPTAWRRQSSVDSSNMLLFSLASSKRTPSVFSINAQDLVGRQHLACEMTFPRRSLVPPPIKYTPIYNETSATQLPTPHWAGPELGRNKHVSATSSHLSSQTEITRTDLGVSPSLTDSRCPATARPANADDEYCATLEYALVQKPQLAQIRSIGRGRRPLEPVAVCGAAWVRNA